MINGPDCSHLSSSGHRWKAAEARLEWREEHGPSPELAPLNSDGEWQERLFPMARAEAKRARPTST
eukprot:39495-Lingulodinium_polyedra.AAC.1